MRKYPIYLIATLFFVAITKLLQVTVFDINQYDKNKRESNKLIKVSHKVKEPRAKRQNSEKPSNSNNGKSSDAKVSSEDSVKLEKSANSTSTKPSLAELKNKYLSPIVSKLPEGQLREDVVIRYYRHQKDANKVSRLSTLGYYIHEKEVTETIGFGSNVMYYGSNVKTEDIKIVALVLLEEGLDLKSIEPSQFDWKSTSIEIGTDSLLISSPTLSQNQVLSFSQ
ncbi:MAG: hypothetical protein HRT61_07120 [Ekhidna sp.]|nr:hypothetical protein [Ekhidna sp.]